MGRLSVTRSASIWDKGRRMKEPIDDAVIGPVGLSVDRSAFVGVGSGNRLQILRRLGHTRPLFGHTAGESGGAVANYLPFLISFPAVISITDQICEAEMKPGLFNIDSLSVWSGSLNSSLIFTPSGPFTSTSSPSGILMPNLPIPPLILSTSARVTPEYVRLSIV